MVYYTSTQQALDRLAELSAKREGADSPIQQGLERLQEAKAKTYSPIQSVALYVDSDVDIGRGTDGSYSNDSLLIAAGLSVASGDAIVADWGLTFSKVGTPAFTTNDTAEFYARPVNTSSMDVTIGAQANQSFPNFGSIIMGQKLGSGEMIEAEAFNCKAVGMPLNFARNSFSAAEVTVKMLYDSAKDSVFKVRWVDA